MNRRRQLTISFIAAVLSGLLVYGVYALQLRQIKLEETVSVVVPKRFVPVGTMLEEGDLKTMPLPRGAVSEQMLTSAADAVGMEASVPLGGEEPLLRWKLDKYRLLPRQGEATFQIPREYVKSISNGIRAGDGVAIYVSGESEDAPSRRLFAGEVVVAAVKTAANVEIDDPKNSNLLSMASGDKESMYASRREANGAIDSINLNLTEAEWLELDTVCKGGSAKLIIAFQASSIDEKGDEP
ncbi:flagellar biosynthesis protein FlgA [Cohnella sp. GCM10027633]|uniref:flagellar biosynthesis protein FlgA n=1 Tax=unclassified Cohnella TaxID=2636738 RepID=UPI0036325674